MTPCAERIAAHIRKSGPIPFSSYMAMALYDRDCGYYTSGPPRIGRDGDFYTSVSTGPVFGGLMAGQFREAWIALGRPGEFTVIEDGADDGRFARDVLEWAEANDPDFFAALRYQLCEPPGRNTAAQEEMLAPFAGKVVRDVATVANGVFFANELLDALPCRRVRFDAASRSWRELFVGLTPDGRFETVEVPPEDRALRRRLERIGTGFPHGYTTEVCPAVGSHVRMAASLLEKGWIFLIDYGYPAAEYYAPHRVTGTLRCYRNHRAHEDPFDAPGETDITAHVDFSLAAEAARQAGLDVVAFRDQARFLTAAARIRLESMDGILPDEPARRWLRGFQTLTHPAHLGMRFHVLVLARNCGDRASSLSGLQGARQQDVDALLNYPDPISGPG